MARHLSTFALVTLLAAGGLAAATPSAAQEPADATTLSTQEAARKRAAMRDALMQVQEARLAYSAMRYTQAVEHYRNALSVLPRGSESAKLQTFIHESLADALIARAIDYRSVGRVQEARQFLLEAVQLDPNNQRAKLELAYTEDTERTNPALSPQHAGDVEEVTRLLTLGYSYLDLGKYDDALRTFQSVHRYDKYNEAARRGIEQVNQRRSEYYRSARQAQRSEMLAEVDKTWDIHPEDEQAPQSYAPGSEAIQAEDPDSQEKAHADLLSRIQVPQFILEETDIEETIRILTSIIRQNEARLTQPQRKLNITTDFGSRDSDATRALLSKRASITLYDASLKDIISEVAKLFGLDYYIVPSGVEFVGKGQSERIISRTFSGVDSHIFTPTGDEDDDAGDDEDSGSSRRIHVSRIDPMGFFKAHGVTFPKGSKVSYSSKSRHLVMHNTRSNLDLAAEVLNNLPTNNWNVVLNIIMVDVSQDDLEDLGFDWLLQMGGSEHNLAGGLEAAVAGVSALPLVSTGRAVSNRDAPVATNGLRSIYQADSAQDLTTLIEQGSVASYHERLQEGGRTPAIFGLRGVWTAADVSVIMRGLSQKKGADTLYNPRLVLDPSAEEMVSFINVREMFFPMEYDPPEVQSTSFSRRVNNGNGNNNNNYQNAISGYAVTAKGAHPTEFVRYGTDEEQLNGIGAIVQVHKAEPSADGRTVRLALTTLINDFEGFIDWGSPIYSLLPTIGDSNSRIERLYLSPNHIFQPIFKRYLTNTNITIADGAVLVIGGMHESRIVRYEDKVPVLGDLPLVGRLFRSEGEHSRRRALLIFAKVNVVEPTGRSISGDSAEDIAAQSPMP